MDGILCIVGMNNKARGPWTNTAIPVRISRSSNCKLLDVLHSTRSVTKTAERLGQTQPTISTWLKQIRDKVGDPLFIRTAKEMIPTPRADQIVEKAGAGDPRSHAPLQW